MGNSMERNFKSININDWEEFGGGAVSKSYYHKTDDTIMMKLYDIVANDEDTFKEYDIAKNVEKLGIDTPKCYDLVISEDGRKGMTFQRVKNKKSFARLIGEEPAKAYDYGEVFGQEMKELHSMECDTKVFADAMVSGIEYIQNNPALSAEEIKKTVEYFENLPKKTTCIHGDCHFGNLIQADGENMWIDLGGFGYGDPRIDIAYLMLPCILSDDRAERMMELYHCDNETRHRFWDGFLKGYAGIANADDAIKFQNDVKPFVAILVSYIISHESGKVRDWQPVMLKNVLEGII